MSWGIEIIVHGMNETAEKQKSDSFNKKIFGMSIPKYTK